MAANEQKIIRKVYLVNKKGKSPRKLVTVPKNSDIEAGDYVAIKKV